MLTMPELKGFYTRVEAMDNMNTKVNSDDLKQLGALAIAGRYLLENHAELLDKYSCAVIGDKDGQFLGIATKEQRISAAVFDILEEV